MRAEMERCLAAPHVVVADGGRAWKAVALVRPLAWDTEFFGLPMARLDAVLRAKDAVADDIAGAVGGALQQARASGVRHVTVRVDAEDTALLGAVEQHGFRLMDSLLTYFTHPHGPAPAKVREVGALRAFEPRDAEALLAITREAYAGFEGRFQRDAHLPQDRAAEFYIEWARQCIAGVMAERIIVSEGADGSVIGWASVRRVEPFSTVSGAPLFAGSLGACRKDRPGAYAGLIRRAAFDNHAAGAITETQTPAANVSTVHIYEAVGARFVRADYMLHAWLD
jgi:L-amino acid N-acyltransferase YncA